MHFVMKFIVVILQGNVRKTKQGLGERDFSSFLANFFKYDNDVTGTTVFTLVITQNNQH